MTLLNGQRQGSLTINITNSRVVAPGQIAADQMVVIVEGCEDQRRVAEVVPLAWVRPVVQQVVKNFGIRVPRGHERHATALVIADQVAAPCLQRLDEGQTAMFSNGKGQRFN